MATHGTHHKPAFGPAGIAITGLLAAVFCVTVIDVCNVPLYAPAAATPVFVLAWLATARLNRIDRYKTWYGTIGLAFVGGWVTWVSWRGWSMNAVIVLVVGSAVAGLLAIRLKPTAAGEPAAPRSHGPLWRPEHARATQLRTLLNAKLRLPADDGCRLISFEMWDRDMGYTAEAEFPSAASITLRQVQDLTDGMASTLRLPNGCNVHVGPGPHHASVIIKVALVNNSTRTIQFNPQCRPRSVTEPFAIGFDGRDQPAQISVHQHAGLFVAKRGGGKSMLLHGIVANLAQCTDNLIWVIDPKAGLTVSPWVEQFAKDRTRRPTIDWVARDADEAVNMLSAAYAVSIRRSEHYAPMMIANNTDILPVSADLPGITLIVDEAHNVFGDKATGAWKVAGDLALAVLQLSRSAIVNILILSQRGVGTYISTDVKMLCDIRMCGPVKQETELGYALDEWAARGLRASDLTGVGEWFLRSANGETSSKIKTPRLLPMHIKAVSLATSEWRPYLDEPSAEAAGDYYAKRWERQEAWLNHLAGHTAIEEATRPTALRPIFETPAGQAPTDLAGFKMQAEQLRQLVEDEETLDKEEATPLEFNWTAEGFAALPVLAEPRNTAAAPTAPTVTPAPVDPGLPAGEAFAYDLIRAAGERGAKTGEIVDAAQAAGIIKRRGTVNDWLNALKDRGLISSPAYATWLAVNADRQ